MWSPQVLFFEGRLRWYDNLAHSFGVLMRNLFPLSFCRKHHFPYWYQYNPYICGNDVTIGELHPTGYLRLSVCDKDSIKEEWRTRATHNAFDTILAFPRFGDISPEPSSQTSKAASAALLPGSTFSSNH